MVRRRLKRFTQTLEHRGGLEGHVIQRGGLSEPRVTRAVIDAAPKGSDLFVSALENEGVDRIFGVPGEENLDVVESLRTSRIELILTRHEQAAAFMAATQGRLTDKPGVCISTLGPGALNFSTGAAYAHLGAMPMILLTGQKATESPMRIDSRSLLAVTFSGNAVTLE